MSLGPPPGTRSPQILLQDLELVGALHVTPCPGGPAAPYLLARAPTWFLSRKNVFWEASPRGRLQARHGSQCSPPQPPRTPSPGRAARSKPVGEIRKGMPRADTHCRYGSPGLCQTADTGAVLPVPCAAPCSYPLSPEIAR
ncbi:hypothetical protein NDU88_002967 [Pleurodeles waltl]|uniref:Uncharacterized protein n=1 Tax=Pleurodeles waltl TaxID=8319 RepID=A0AAV7WMP6_PLEWA|nr:hypothetical protein NDU88_002967 [Pleurodeles waltl]